jgi:UDP-2,3-diacylglucosamine hydrolase
MTARTAAVFLSDVHLSAAHPATTAAFLQFLDLHVAGKAARLYILGDLFEYWVGDDDIGDAFNANIIGSLRRLSDSGTELFFISGNRDFLIGAGFADAAGATLLPDPAHVRIDGQSLLLSHGDSLCTDDLQYQAFKAMVRNPAYRSAFLAKPLSERHGLVEAMRAGSDTAKKEKAAEIMDVSDEAVAQWFAQNSETVLVHGHTHRPAHHRLVVGGRQCERWVLPDWDADAVPPRGGGLILDAGGLRAIGLAPANPETERAGAL